VARVAPLIAVACLALAVAGSGSAGGVGTWSRVTGTNLTNTDQAGLARNAGGLHVIWLSKAGTKQDLLQTTISPSGSQGATTKVVAGWGSLANGSLVSTSSGLQAFFAGIRSTSTSDPYSSGTVFTAAGASWTLGSGPVAAPSNAYASDVVASTLEKDGTPVTAWTGTSGFYVHEGVDPAKPNVKVQAACCAYNASLATDSTTGAVYAAWYSNAAGGYGIHWRRVLPALGPDRVLPGSASGDRKSAVSPIQAVGIVGRAGAPGVCTAWGLGYPTWKAIDVGCTSRAGAVRVWAGPVTHVTVAPGPDGRVWAIWSTSSTIYAARSNRAVTQFGAAVPVAPPAGTSDIWNVTGEGAASPTAPLDLLASVTRGGIAFWHTQVEPGLTLVVHAKTFTILDAGDPVDGAKVQLAGPQAATLSAPAGTATAGTLVPGRYTVTATASGYTSAKASFIIPKS
jgi:hypothetical protein